MSVDLLRSFLDLVPHPVTVDAQNEAVIADRSQRQPQYPTARCAVPQAFSDHLTSLAARTLVPESESSRQGGAGAGLLDND